MSVLVKDNRIVKRGYVDKEIYERDYFTGPIHSKDKLILLKTKLVNF